MRKGGGLLLRAPPLALLFADLNVPTNPVFQRMLGYTERESQELTFIDITHEEDLISGNDPELFESDLVKKPSSTLYLRRVTTNAEGSEPATGQRSNRLACRASRRLGQLGFRICWSIHLILFGPYQADKSRSHRAARSRS